jgi:large subunit ribosomal protein L6e
MAKETNTKKSPRMPRNYEIAPGLSRFSRARMYHKRGLWEKLKKPLQKKTKTSDDAQKFVTKPVGGGKNGKERKIATTKAARFLDVSPRAVKERRNPKKAQLRKSITPGTILIILAGRHRGKRVVFLKQLEKSGLLLVTGPLKLNATPLRRIAQAFVIATKTKVDVSNVKLPDHINDDYFKRIVKKNKTEDGIFTSDKEDYSVSDQRKSDQKSVDASILDTIRKHADKKFLFGYLGSRFSIGKNQRPHALVY